MSDDAEVLFECVVDADVFARALLGVSKEETRYHLNGVHVSPSPAGGATLCATDGSMLIVLHDPEAYIVGEAIVKLERPLQSALSASGILLERRLLAARVSKKGRGRAFVIDQPPSKDNAPGSTHLAARGAVDDPDARVKGAQFGAVTIDGTFPDWRRVLPEELNSAAPVWPFDQSRLASIARALCPRKSRNVCITPSKDGNAPMLVTSTAVGGPAGFAVLMPLRNEPKAASVPAWAHREPQKEAA